MTEQTELVAGRRRSMSSKGNVVAARRMVHEVNANGRSQMTGGEGETVVSRAVDKSSFADAAKAVEAERVIREKVPEAVAHRAVRRPAAGRSRRAR